MRNTHSAQNNRHNKSSNQSKNKGTTMFKSLLTKLMPKPMAGVVKCESSSQGLIAMGQFNNALGVPSKALLNCPIA